MCWLQEIVWSIYMYDCLPDEQCPFTCMTAYRMNNVHLHV